MTPFSNEVVQLFQQWNRADDCGKLSELHRELIERRVEAIAYGDPSRLSATERTRLNCHVLKQALLHRSERLIVSSGTMLLEKNVYGLALLVRGHIEGAAVLGYFCNRIKSLTAGNIKFETFEWDIADAIMGAKHDLFSEANPPTNILTCVEKADKFIDTEIFEGEKRGMLKDCYNWLSEFAHPNFLSNSAAFSLDRKTSRIVFRHASDLLEKDFDLAGYLVISASLFVELFDQFSEQTENAFGIK